MAQFGFCIALGWDVDDAPNIETFITDAPTVLDDQFVAPYGSVREVALDGSITRTGKRNIVWVWDHMTQADFNTLLDTFWEDSNSTPVTIWTITERGTYEGYNAIAERPYPGEHYRHAFGGDIVDLRIPLWDLTFLPFSFDDSFNFGDFG